MLLVPQSQTLRLISRASRKQLPHESSTEHESRASVCEVPAVGSVGGVLSSHVVCFVRIQLVEEPEEGIPEEINIALEKNIPLGLWIDLVCFIHHGQKLEAVESPSLAPEVYGIALDMRLLMFQIDIEIRVIDGVRRRELGENIRYNMLSNLLFMVRYNKQVGDTTAHGSQMSFTLCVLAGPRLQHDLYILELVLREIGAEVCGVRRGREEGFRLRFVVWRLLLLGVFGFDGRGPRPR